MPIEYKRSLAGWVQRIQRPGNRWTAYQHDNLGNVIQTTMMARGKRLPMIKIVRY
ncbi:hypothetical protein [Lysinibacillus mangiferihumi]|uniref:hypothetical protein n=1 Tax=Lysinibacillus mangiferihumi TaxID=1130819 RepID=UPI00142D88C9|nr:hypothetical protein [Lysinibacillus mangiferihumi]